jgi:hypothetical protein
MYFMHNETMIIGDAVEFTGYYNPSEGAEGSIPALCLLA